MRSEIFSLDEVLISKLMELKLFEFGDLGSGGDLVMLGNDVKKTFWKIRN